MINKTFMINFKRQIFFFILNLIKQIKFNLANQLIANIILSSRIFSNGKRSR